jgi:hypothetical protein
MLFNSKRHTVLFLQTDRPGSSQVGEERGDVGEEVLGDGGVLEEPQQLVLEVLSHAGHLGLGQRRRQVRVQHLQGRDHLRVNSFPVMNSMYHRQV